ncbi:hypothetical protein [Melissococcus sp. OM08-11BH]|uniref:hypothetical protein n=1 Tax=Melissococcus sp. OM08-11BH TaxID=2293110 RepID=UPI001314C07A|nr:hypothetical protein [Melissococcus sp. OM08-11BH]
MKKITIFLLLLVGIIFSMSNIQAEASKLPDEQKMIGTMPTTKTANVQNQSR